jgi:ribosome maturation factor RimP
MIEQKVHDLLEPTLKQLGYELVQVRMFGAGSSKTLQILADRTDGTKLLLGDLEKISKTVSSIMDVENVIDSRYHLEVSSPGVDRPLVKRADYEKHLGQLINVRLIRANDKGRKFKGNIVAVGEDNFTFKPENFPENFTIDFLNVDTAKLVMTDEMFGKGKKRKF